MLLMVKSCQWYRRHFYWLILFPKCSSVISCARIFFFSPLGRKFFNDKLHVPISFTSSPKCIVKSVCSSRQGFSKYHGLTSCMDHSLRGNVPLIRSTEVGIWKRWNVYFFHQHTSTSSTLSFLKGIFSLRHKQEVESQHQLPICTVQRCLKFNSIG